MKFLATIALVANFTSAINLQSTFMDWVCSDDCISECALNDEMIYFAYSDSHREAECALWCTNKQSLMC